MTIHPPPPPPTGNRHQSANPAWTRSVHLDAPGQRHGQQPVSGTADPGVVKQDKPSRGSVDTTKTRSDPRRVRMSSGERPIGAAKGKQSDTEALCHTPPHHQRNIDPVPVPPAISEKPKALLTHWGGGQGIGLPCTPPSHNAPTSHSGAQIE